MSREVSDVPFRHGDTIGGGSVPTIVPVPAFLSVPPPTLVLPQRDTVMGARRA